MRKYLFFLSLLFLFNITFSQKQVLYNFAELPQSLLLNPAYETNYKFHIGVPLISSFSSSFGSSGLVLSDLFGVDGRNINDKVSTVLNSLSTRDFFQLNTQIEIFNGGFRLDDNNYLSFGFYHEIDAFSNYPKDLFLLFSEGNEVNRTFSASQINYKVDYTGVLHFGLTRKINKQVTLGTRFKIYSSAANLESNYNRGTFTTVQGTNNIYSHNFSNVDFEARTSGLISNNEYIDDPTAFLKNTFLGGNLGFGLDFGVNLRINDQLEFSASILDLGFINHKENIKNTKLEGDYVFEGVEFLYDESSSVNYWNQIDEQFKEQLPSTNNQESYISWRPTKLNAALKYSFGERRSKICYDNRYKDFYTDALGVQLFNVFRPGNQQFSLTAFYQKSFSDKFQTKITYTLDDFSLYNLGAGISTQIGNINFYGMVDNILEFRNLAKANSISLHFGFNLLFN
jgi:hypothetical protein